MQIQFPLCFPSLALKGSAAESFGTATRAEQTELVVWSMFMWNAPISSRGPAVCTLTSRHKTRRHGTCRFLNRLQCVLCASSVRSLRGELRFMQLVLDCLLPFAAERMDDSKKSASGNVPVMHSNAHELRTSTVLLRITLLVFAVTSLCLLATDSETSSVPIPFFGLPKPIFITKTAEYKLVKGLKFFVDALGLVIAYTALHLLFNIGLLVTRGTVVGSRTVAWTSFVGDSIMAYLLVSAASVASEVGYLAERGAPDLMWNKVCNYFEHFCTVYAISVVACFLGAFAAFFVVGVSAYHLFRLYGIQQHKGAVSRQQPEDP